MRKRARVFIYGLVQGVYYRDWAKENAKELDLKGWIKNLPDRRVEAVFEGLGERIEEMIKRCQKGPGAAQVDQVEVIWEECKDDFSTFEIIYHS